MGALLISVFLSQGPARGEDVVQGTNKSLATRPSGSADKIGSELVSAGADVQKDPSNAAARIRLGDLLVQKGALDEALQSYDEALRLNPHAHEAKTGRGVVLARKGDFQDAERALKDALYLNPNPVRTHYELGLVYERLGDLEKAVDEFKEGIKKHIQGR